MKNLFVDTNVIIDVLADRKPYSDASSKLFDAAEKGRINIFISALSYSHVYYVVKKLTTHKQLLSVLKNLDEMTETLDVTKQIISESLIAEFKDFEDAIQYRTALSNKKISAIVTRDYKDYKKSELPILSPEEVIGMIG